VITAQTTHEPFEHAGLLYSGPREYVAVCVGFVERSLRAGDPVLVAVPEANAALIRQALGVRAGTVEYADMKVAGRNPGRIIPWVLLSFADAHPGRRVRIVGEPMWPGRSALEYPACAVHEALVNTAFAGRDAAIGCPYDVANLPAEVVDDVRRTHPVIIDADGSSASASYTDPITAAARFNHALPLPPHDAERVHYAQPADLAGLRRLVARAAAVVGLSVDRVAAMATAVSELATNSLRHTHDRRGTLTVWTEPGLLVCQIDDTGRLTDPLAGRLPPALRPHGMGLALVNHLVDLVRVHGRRDGTSFRIQMHAGAGPS
jgi:anti-sigma regulatory factor (Ser/Thr protein kinase)